MPSANDFGAQAFRLLGLYAPGEDPSAEDGEEAFDVLNDWIDSLGTQRLTIYLLTRTAHTLTSGTASYTIGTGGTINIVRPLWIERAGLITNTADSTPTEIPVRVLTDDERARIAQKTLQSSYTTGIWYDHNWSAGLARIFVYPIPNVGTTQLVIYTPTAITEFADQSTNYTFPPGYRRAIRYNLAMELAAHYPAANVPQWLPKKAVDALAEIKRANTRLSDVITDRTFTKRGGMTASRFASGAFLV